MLEDLLLAGEINRLLGGAFVGPFDVGQLPWELLDAVEALQFRLKTFVDGRRAVETRLASWRAQWDREKH